MEVEFNFDGNTLAGKNITVFEECYLNEELIAVHKDIEDVIDTLLEYKTIELVARLKPLVTYKC